MIRILLIVSVLFFAAQSHSQFFEGFEGTFPPAGWIVTDNGVGTAQSWKRLLSPPYQPYAGNYSAIADRENIGQASTSEDWLITPGIAIGENGSLNFFSRQTVTGDVGTIYQIRVSTTSQADQSSFSTIATWTETDINNVFDAYSQKICSLAQFSGQTVYIAFVKTFTQPSIATSGDRWLLDNVTVWESSSQYNSITGNVAFSNTIGDCGSAVFVSGIPISVEASDGSFVFYDDGGSYLINTTNTDLVVSAQSPSPYFTMNPPSYSFTFPGTGNSEMANFCLTPNGGQHPDLDIVILPYIPAIPGNQPIYKLVYKNKGTMVQSGTITFGYNDDALDYVSSYPPGVQNGNVLSFEFTDLAPFESRTISVTMEVGLPTDLPPVNLGDILNFIANVTSVETDETISDNTANFNQTVAASYDPNDKLVTEGNIITPMQTGDYLHYIIRFQNTGTAPASKVVISDLLEEDLDESTLRTVSGSHPYTMSLSGKRVEFTFDNINLPPSAEGEDAGSGYIAFKIKPASGVGIGSVIQNDARIYFDYNLPITTNTVTTTVTALAINETSIGDHFTMHPNPAKNEFYISSNDDTSITEVSFYNMMGQLIKSVENKHTGKIAIDISTFTSGMYFIEINSNVGKVSKKLIKL